MNIDEFQRITTIVVTVGCLLLLIARLSYHFSRHQSEAEQGVTRTIVLLSAFLPAVLWVYDLYLR